jgi:hypothetical protein
VKEMKVETKHITEIVLKWKQNLTLLEKAIRNCRGDSILACSFVGFASFVPNDNRDSSLTHIVHLLDAWDIPSTARELH